MIADDWLAKAEQTVVTAVGIIDLGDPDRACSAAYYAMFYAARAVLYHTGQPDRALAKTHSGLIASFHQFVVLPGLIGAKHGRALQTEFVRRLAADYDVRSIGEQVANDAVATARDFVAAVRRLMERTE